jgi:hypothetical protein
MRLGALKRRVVAVVIGQFLLVGCAREVRFMPVAQGVNAHIGEKGGRSVDNEPPLVRQRLLPIETKADSLTLFDAFAFGRAGP